jgi:hypothetical protein
VYNDPEDKEEDEGNDESVAEEVGWCAKHISIMESSGIAADDSGCVIRILIELKIYEWQSTARLVGTGPQTTKRCERGSVPLQSIFS